MFQEKARVEACRNTKCMGAVRASMRSNWLTAGSAGRTRGICKGTWTFEQEIESMVNQVKSGRKKEAGEATRSRRAGADAGHHEPSLSRGHGARREEASGTAVLRAEGCPEQRGRRGRRT